MHYHFVSKHFRIHVYKSVDAQQNKTHETRNVCLIYFIQHKCCARSKYNKHYTVFTYAFILDDFLTATSALYFCCKADLGHNSSHI